MNEEEEKGQKEEETMKQRKRKKWIKRMDKENKNEEAQTS